MKLFLQNIIKKFGFEIRRTNARHVFWKDVSGFYDLFLSVKDRMAIKEDRAYMLYQWAMYAKTVAGDAAQLGVYRGGSSKVIARALAGSGKDFILFDTFEGLPVEPGTFTDGRSYFTDTSKEDVATFLKGEKVTFAQGFFPDTAAPFADRKFAFVYLDADLEESTRAGIEFFWPRMSSGAVLISDDYGSPYWPGVKKVFDTFCKENNVALIRTTHNQCMLIKH